MFLKCIKSVVMDEEPEYVAFVEGRIYQFNYQGNMLRCVNENGHPHYFEDFRFSPDDWSNWFEKVE